MRKNKKSQIAIFLIVGIFIVLSIVILIISNISSRPKSNNSVFDNIDILNAKLFMENCIEKEMLEIGEIIKTSGRYVDLPENIVVYEDMILSYFLYNDIINIPTIIEIQEQIIFFALESIDFCVNEYKKTDEHIEFTDVEIKIDLNNSNQLRIELEFKKIIDNIIYQEKSLVVYNIPYPIKELIEASKKIVEYELNNPYTFSIVKINEIVNSHNFNISIINNKNETIIYRIYNDINEMYFATTYNYYNCTNIPVDDQSSFLGIIEWCMR
ncbi:MAG: hypothetical protein ACMXYG_02450 [Candidatus Woesearchaeota archaeon]